MSANKITIQAFQNPLTFKDSVNIDSAKTYNIDYSAWSEENNNISTMTWTVKSGNAAVSNKTLSSNVATALITFSQVGKSLIQIKADSGTEIFTTYLELLVKDPNMAFVNDYDL